MQVQRRNQGGRNEKKIIKYKNISFWLWPWLDKIFIKCKIFNQ